MIKINFKLVCHVNIMPILIPATCPPSHFHFVLICCCFFVFTIQTNFPEMMNRYKQLLTYIRSAVTRNYSEKSINSILDYISTSKQVCIKNVSEFLGSNSGNCFEVAFDHTATKTKTVLVFTDGPAPGVL